MKAALLKVFLRVSFFFGAWPVRFFAWWVATGYFFFRAPRRKASVRLYRVIFPSRSRWYHLYCSWRQFHSFAATFADRAELESGKGKSVSVEGDDGIVAAGKRGSGGIILISHLGSYEITARAFQGRGLK